MYRLGCAYLCIQEKLSHGYFTADEGLIKRVTEGCRWTNTNTTAQAQLAFDLAQFSAQAGSTEAHDSPFHR